MKSQEGVHNFGGRGAAGIRADEEVRGAQSRDVSLQRGEGRQMADDGRIDFILQSFTRKASAKGAISAISRISDTFDKAAWHMAAIAALAGFGMSRVLPSWHSTQMLRIV